MTPMLASPRLTLRPPEPADADRIALYLSDFAVSGNLARVPFPYRLSDAKAWLRSRRANLPPTETSFAIDLPGEGFAGQVGFHLSAHGVVIGYWLGTPYWGRGIMTGAARLALDWYFQTTDALEVLSGVFAFNQASLAVQHKLGFVETGRSSLLCLARGREVEHIDTRLTRAAWMDKST